MSFQEPHAYQHADAEKAQEDFAAAPKKVHSFRVASQTLQISNAFDARLPTKLR
jgi:hypothetical protein